MLYNSNITHIYIYMVMLINDKKYDGKRIQTARGWCTSQEGLKIVSTVSCLSGGPGPQFFWGKTVMRPRSMVCGAPAPCGRLSPIQDQN